MHISIANISQIVTGLMIVLLLQNKESPIFIFIFEITDHFEGEGQADA